MRTLRTVPIAVIATALTLGFVSPSAGAVEPPATMPTATSAFTPTLAYVPCPADEPIAPRTRCATLTVPLDWQTPNDGRTIDIALRVLRSRERGGGLTFNPGGPGASGIADAPDVYSLLPESVQDRFDFVYWDPRGVGLSEPTIQPCTSADVMPPATGPVDWDAFWQEYADVVGAANAACFAAQPDAAPYLGTWQVVRDLDAMRAALGYAQWNYWGMSYGTRIGNTYARTFPDRVRALVQDGSVMANESMYRFGSTSPAGAALAVQIYAANTGRAQARKINTIMSYLDDTVIDGPEYDVPITRWVFGNLLNVLLRSQGAYSFVRSIVNQLYIVVTEPSASARSRAADAMARAQSAAERMPSYAPRDTSDTVFPVALVNCADLHDRPTVAELATASRSAAASYGVSTGMMSSRGSMCLGLPAEYSPSSDNGDRTVTLAHPPMFVLSTGDSATPWAWGRSLANTFSRSRLVSYSGTQHVTYRRTPSRCVNDTVTRYLLTLQVPAFDVDCRFIATPSPPP